MINIIILETFKTITNLTNKLNEKETLIAKLESKIIKMEVNYAEEMKKLNQIYNQKETQRQKAVKEIRNKLAQVELELEEKNSTIKSLAQNQSFFASPNKRCDECERLHKIIKEMEQQIESYKASVYRKGSYQKTSINNDNSDIKSYVKDIDNGNIELESMLLDVGYKDNIFTCSPKSNNMGKWTKLSFISLSHQKPLNETNEEVGHTKNASHCEIPNEQLATFAKHRSNISETPKYWKFSLDRKKSQNSHNLKSKKGSFTKVQEEERTLNSYTVEKRIPDEEKIEVTEMDDTKINFPYFSNGTDGHCNWDND